MTGSFSNLLSAMATFVIGHFVLASLPIRQLLIARLGENGFRGLFSVFALVTLTWVIAAYNSTPFIELWAATPAFNVIPLVLMSVSCIFAVAGLTTRSVTMVGGERAMDEPNPTPGIMTVTRHPLLWAIALWSLTHLAVTGDIASVVLFVGISVLTIGGMVHIDHRRAQIADSAWGPIAMRTSLIPFAAAITKRTRIDWSGIGVARFTGGIVLYVVLTGLHEYVFGVTPLPG
jgi:uncharacterized membrane protein